MDNLELPAGVAGLVQQAAAWGVKIVGVLVALFIAWLIAGSVRRAIVRASEKRGFDITLGRFFANIARYAILAGAILGCLGVFGIQTASFAAVIAAMGLAVGLAFQGTLSNFASGVMLLVFRPFKVGDFIRAGGESGTVKELELFVTELCTPDNRRIIVPNSKVFGDTIENVSHHPTRRVEVPVGVSYSADLQHCRAALLQAAQSLSTGLKDPAPVAVLADLGDSSVNWKVRVWCNASDFWPTTEALVEAIKTQLDAAQIEIPFPQLDVHTDTKS